MPSHLCLQGTLTWMSVESMSVSQGSLQVALVIRVQMPLH